MASTDEPTVAEQMLEGEICEGCQCNLPGEAPGHPRRCRECKKDAPTAAGYDIALNVPARKRVQEKRQDPLPAWAINASAEGLPFVIRLHCCYCTRHFGLEDAVRDHLRDVHGIDAIPEQA